MEGSTNPEPVASTFPSGETASVVMANSFCVSVCQRRAPLVRSRHWMLHWKPILLERDKERRRPGETVHCVLWYCSRANKGRINRRPGTSHKSTRTSYQPTASRLPCVEKLTSNPRSARFVSVTRALLRVSCQR